ASTSFAAAMLLAAGVDTAAGITFAVSFVLGVLTDGSLGATRAAAAGAGIQIVSPLPSSLVSHSLMWRCERSERTRKRRPAVPLPLAQASSQVAWIGRNPSGTAK